MGNHYFYFYLDMVLYFIYDFFSKLFFFNLFFNIEMIENLILYFFYFIFL
jgi:hypothetical protein